MIVDSKGNMFENRRKERTDRRKNDIDTTGGRRQNDRRKAAPQLRHTDKKK